MRRSRSGSRSTASPSGFIVPFAAIKGFFDPSVQFGLQFDTSQERRSRASADAAPGPDALAPASAAPKGLPSLCPIRCASCPGGRAAQADDRRHRPPTKRAAARRRRRGGPARSLPQEVTRSTRFVARRPDRDCPSLKSTQEARMAKTRTETDSFGPIEVAGRPLLGRSDPAIAARISASALSACRCR